MTEPLTFGRPFVLHRGHDVSGVSGMGIVADGILFPDGHAAIHWRGKWPLTTPHPDGMDSVLANHDNGGQGDLRVLWADHDELRRKTAADIVAAFDVPPEVCGTEAEVAYYRTEIEKRLRGASTEVRVDYITIEGVGSARCAVEAKGSLSGYVDAVMPVVERLQEQRDRRPWAAECSAQHLRFSGGRQCIRAAQHRGDHIDERGYHWSDTVAVYPVHDGPEREAQAATPRCVCGDPIEWFTGPGESAGWIHGPAGTGPILDVHKPRPASGCEHRGPHPGFTCAEVDQEAASRVSTEQEPPNRGPLSGIEVRDPCPYCESCSLIPRHLMCDHISAQHPEVTVASDTNGSPTAEPPADSPADNPRPAIPHQQVRQAAEGLGFSCWPWERLRRLRDELHFTVKGGT